METSSHITASVIIPCWNSARWLDSALDSVLAAADAFVHGSTEIICTDDGSTDSTLSDLKKRASADSRIRVVSIGHSGVSAARNAAIDMAHGKYVFFLDPDDTVAPEWISAGVAEMESSQADWCVSPFRIRNGESSPFTIHKLKGDYRFSSQEEITSGYISRLIGYSFDDLRRWFKGEELFSSRELGSVCRCVFKLEIIRKYNVRFDETVGLGEDAFFNCEYLLHAKKTTVLDRPLYDYTVRSSGATVTLNASCRRIENKFRVLALRHRLNKISGGRLAHLYAASYVLAPLEIIATFRKSGVGLLKAIREARKYLSDPAAAKALQECPLSFRRPVFSAGVIFLRLIAPRKYRQRQS